MTCGFYSEKVNKREDKLWLSATHKLFHHFSFRLFIIIFKEKKRWITWYFLLHLVLQRVISFYTILLETRHEESTDLMFNWLQPQATAIFEMNQTRKITSVGVLYGVVQALASPMDFWAANTYFVVLIIFHIWKIKMEKIQQTTGINPGLD